MDQVKVFELKEQKGIKYEQRFHSTGKIIFCVINLLVLYPAECIDRYCMVLFFSNVVVFYFEPNMADHYTNYTDSQPYEYEIL